MQGYREKSTELLKKMYWWGLELVLTLRNKKHLKGLVARHKKDLVTKLMRVTCHKK